MAYYLYKKIKASRTEKSSDGIPHETAQPSPYESTQDGGRPTSGDRAAALLENKTSPQFKAEQRRRRLYRWKLIGSLFMPYLLATIDLTIVATAVPFIASHFDQLGQLNWIVTAFTLTSTALIPTFGQLADVFGRHAVLQLATLLMLVGSILCAAAQTWGMLLLGRALQGMSSAGLMTTIMIILADNVSLEENAKNNSFFALVGGIAYSIGPVVGGWRYCFVISIPVAFVSHIIIYIFLRQELKQGTYSSRGNRLAWFFRALATLDIIGTILFIFGVGLIILGTAWGGSTYPWTSAKVLAPLVIGSICFVSFFGYECLLEKGSLSRLFPTQKPMLPYSMFKRLDTLWLVILQFSAGAAMYSVFYYIGIYFTLVEEYPASKAGVQLLYYIPGLGAGVYLAILLCNTFPAQTFPPLALGTLLETLGIALITYGIRTQKANILNGMMVLAGAGTGIRMMPATLHAAGVWPDKIAAVLSLLRFALPFGGGADSLDFVNSLPKHVQEGVRLAGRDAIMWAYIAVLPILGVSLVTGLCLGNVWIKPKPKGDQEQGAERVGESDVVYVPYLYAVLKGVEKYKHVSRPHLEGDMPRDTRDGTRP
ncbi:major facilitator superfamily domain-containing protein [Aspergillus varians]